MMITAPELQTFIDTRNRFSEDKLQILTFDGVQFAESVDQNGGAVRIQIEQMRSHYSLFDDNPRLDPILPPAVRRGPDSDMYPLAAIISGVFTAVAVKFGGVLAIDSRGWKRRRLSGRRVEWRH